MKHLIAVLLVLAALVSSGLAAMTAGGESDGMIRPTGLYEEWIEV